MSLFSENDPRQMLNLSEVNFCFLQGISPWITLLHFIISDAFYFCLRDSIKPADSDCQNNFLFYEIDYCLVADPKNFGKFA